MKEKRDFALKGDNLGKLYQIYEKPLDRLKQSLWRSRRKFYSEFWALQNFSFEITKGETIGVIGENGSGKSTLLQLICGTLRPTQGALEINGRISALLELGAGFNPDFTGRENVYMNAAIMGLPREETEKRFEEIESFAGIGPFMDQPVKTYSSGMYVRLAFAVAINVSPDILLVDEALSVGDIRFQQKCMAKIRDFCKNGTVVFVTHDMVAISELCHRVYWLEGGLLRMEGKPKYVVEKYLEHMYEGKSRNMESPEANRSQIDFSKTGFKPLDKNVRQFGDGRVEIEAVNLSSESAKGVVYSGAPCQWGMIFTALKAIRRPILGFSVKDRLGREVFVDNTAYMNKRVEALKPGKRYMIRFLIESWPNLNEGDYALSLAVADGDMDNHVQCHWVHDALIITSIPKRPVSGVFTLLDTRVDFTEVKN